MANVIVKTLDSKMLQDPIVGMIYTSKRPHLSTNNNFIADRVSGSPEYKRKADLEILANNFETKDGVSDADLELEWKEFVKGGSKGGVEAFANAFVKKYGKDKASGKKGAEE